MNILDLLLGNSNGAPQSPPAPPSNAPVGPPASPPQSYGDYLRLLTNAAALDEKAHPSNLLSWISGTGRDAAAAHAAAIAPEAWQAYKAGLSKVQGGQLDVGQDLVLLNRTRAQQGLPPIDPDNIPASYNAGAAPQAATGSPQAPANSAPHAPQGGTPSMAPPVGMAAPLPMSSPQQPPFLRMAANAAAVSPRLPAFPAQPIIAPASQPGPVASPPQVNPLQARRALFMRMAGVMAGLPKFAGLIPAYSKQAGEGLPAGTAVLPNGEVADAISGRPIQGDVGSLAANRAGQIATAEQAPKTAGQIQVAGVQAGLDRETNWQRYAAENAFKGPQLLRAPDGSVVGVTPAQLAADASNGALNGYRPLDDEDQKALGAFGVQYAKDQASLPDVRHLQTTLGNMLDQAKSFPPGTFGDLRHAAGRILTGLNVDPDTVTKAVGNPAGADVIVKQTLTLAMDRLKSSFGASREAGFVLQMAQRANPNVETQPEAYSFMLNTMNQAAQRQADYITAQHAYRQQHGSIDGFAEKFDKANPVGTYVNRAVVATYGVPQGSHFLGRNKGRPIFLGVNGKKFMVQN